MLTATWPRVLIYKRNHTGDPESNGTFGYEAVANRITWAGVRPRRVGILEVME